MNGWIKNIAFLLIMILAVLSTSGCNKKEKIQDIEKIKDIEFTVCDETNMPQQLVELINNKKQAPFKLTYGNKEYLYIVIGYGQQDRNDLCITVDELYLSDNAIYIDTTLTSKEPSRMQIVTYPYIAVKCEQYNLPVVFN